MNFHIIELKTVIRQLDLDFETVIAELVRNNVLKEEIASSVGSLFSETWPSISDKILKYC